MSTERFTYHQHAVHQALAEHSGPVLQVGTNDDPAHLKDINPERVINADLFDYDAILDRPNRVDITFDVARDDWPYSQQECALIVMGDIIEHLTPAEILTALTKARAAGQRICITVPMDTRPENNDERADLFPRGAVHRTIVTDAMLRDALTEAGWTVTDFQALGPGIWWADYFFVTAE